MSSTMIQIEHLIKSFKEQKFTIKQFSLMKSTLYEIEIENFHEHIVQLLLNISPYITCHIDRCLIVRFIE